jgi:hypothetical protein
MPACPVPLAQTPLDFAVDAALLQLPRFLCEETIARYRLPLTSPFFCQDWPRMLPTVLNRDALMAVSDLRALLLGRLDTLVAEQSAQAATLALPWSHLAGLHRDLYEQASALVPTARASRR